MKEELDIRPSLSDEQIAVGSAQRDLHCPSCGCPNSHVKAPHLIMDDKWHGNGELAITPLWSECGCEWEICIGFHKGKAPIFIRITESCQ